MKMFGMDTLDWRQVFIDWDAITEDVILAGTPMNKDGRMANDGTVYGILMDDVQRKRNKQGRVVISGVIDLEACEKHSGITLSGACKAALPDVWSQTGGGGSGGVTSWNDLKDRPFEDNRKVEYLMPETAVTATDQGADLPYVELVVGENYIVTWDGTEYACISYRLPGDSTVLIGNMVFAGGDDNGMPFIIGCNALGENAFVMCAPGTYSVSIQGTVGELETIDPKFLAKSLHFGEKIENRLILKTEGSDFELCNPEGYGYGSVWDYDPATEVSTGVDIEEVQYWTVILNGITYEKVRVRVYTDMAIGGAPTVREESGVPIGYDFTDIPFWFTFYNGHIEVNTKDYHENVSLEFYQPTTTIKTLDPKFLPNPSELPAEWIAALKTALGI